MNKIIFIAGGGTGGHLFPALAIGDALTNKGFSIIYIGSKFGIEKKQFEKNNLIYYLLNIKGIQRNLSIKSIVSNMIFPIRFAVSYLFSIIIIKKHNPVAIIGTGGYASALPLIAGLHFKIPLMIQEQNSIPGMITKIMKNRVGKIFLGYEYSKSIFKNKNSIYTGNPLRTDLIILNKEDCKRNLEFSNNKKLILVIGGSQGAKPINSYIKNNIHFFNNNDIQLLWQVGSSNYDSFNKNIKSKNIRIKKFINNMSEAYSAADLVISRAGALALSELTMFNKAMILIPFPNAANDHQNINAKYLHQRNACVIINQNNLKKGDLQESILDLIKHNNKIKNLEKNSKLLSMPNATKTITKQIIHSIK